MARKPAMFTMKEIKARNGAFYKKYTCNAARGGCGEELPSAFDKTIHRNHCFKDVPKKAIGWKCVCGMTIKAGSNCHGCN